MSKGVPTPKTDRDQLLTEGTRWLLEMEALNNPHMKNALILNVYKVSAHIQETELLIDESAKKMLIYLKLSGFGKLFHKRAISQAVLDMLQEVLPSFQFRVTLDPVLFLKTVKGLKAHVETREKKFAEFRRQLAEHRKKLAEEKKAKEEAEKAASEASVPGIQGEGAK